MPAANFWVSDASFSRCGHYRWWLSRGSNASERTLLFIGLNPSLASVSRDDPTLRRLLGFADRWHYGRLVVVNLFARISPSPVVLRRSDDPIGDLNDVVIDDWLDHWSSSPESDLCCGWGVQGQWLDRDLVVIPMIQQHHNRRRQCFPLALGPQSLGKTKGGQPRHPLYLSGQAPLQPILWAEPPLIRHPEAMDPLRTVRR